MKTNSYVYKGEWKKNKKNGFGEYTDQKGNVFKGIYKNDKRNGEGVLYNNAKKKSTKGIW